MMLLLYRCMHCMLQELTALSASPKVVDITGSAGVCVCVFAINIITKCSISEGFTVVSFTYCVVHMTGFLQPLLSQS